MKLNRLILVLAALLLAALAGTAFAPTASPTSALAELKDAQGKVVGNAIFTTTTTGAVKVRVTLTGLAGTAGDHGIHVHTIGSCSPTFSAAGGHFNPAGAKHGLDNLSGPHAGDMLTLSLSADGAASYEAITDRITLGAGTRSLFDTDGSALVIHAKPDDQITDPTGNSGDRIACGVIVTSAAANVAVNTANGSVIFETCKGACLVKEVDPTTLGLLVKTSRATRWARQPSTMCRVPRMFVS